MFWLSVATLQNHPKIYDLKQQQLFYYLSLFLRVRKLSGRWLGRCGLGLHRTAVNWLELE